MNIYICPMCKQENAEHQKFCLNCGTWLIDAKKKTKPKKTSNRLSIAIIVLAIIGATWYFSSNSNPFAQKITFDQVDAGPYSFSQLQITTGVKSSIPVDLSVKENSKDPIEVVAVFYTDDGTRLARASTIIMQQMPAGYTTTINLKLDEPANLKAAKSVRIEVKPLTLIDMIDKVTEKLK